MVGVGMEKVINLQRAREKKQNTVTASFPQSTWCNITGQYFTWDFVSLISTVVDGAT
jgi:hypothetical protein